MKKRLTFFIILASLARIPAAEAADSYAGDVLTPSYPEAFEDEIAVLKDIEGEIKGRIFLTKDSFERVRDFYRNDLGEETSEISEFQQGGPERTLFIYDKWNPGFYFSTVSGVMIYSEGGPGAYRLGDVFNNLTAQSHKGNILRKDVEKIKEKYAHLGKAYFPKVYCEETQTAICKSRDIYNKIFDPDGLREREADAEASQKRLRQKMEQAMSSGNIHKMQEIAMELQQASREQMGDFYSDEDVGLSKEWLERVDQIAYRSRIEISDYFTIEE